MQDKKEKEKMQEDQEQEKTTPKPKKGAYANIDTDIKERIKFTIGKTETVLMKCDGPKEIDWEDSVFYVFDVEHNKQEKVISTSAWSLLRGLKEQEPYNGKILNIKKEMKGTKQVYSVEEYQ
jgi:hypothetical protein